MKYIAFPEYEHFGVAGEGLEGHDGFLKKLGYLA